MSKKNLLSGRDKELQEMAEQYEAAKAENRTIYLDADDLADLADWYAVHHKYAMATEVVEYGLGIHPDNTALLVEQAYLFLDTQHKEQAKDILERIAEESSEVKVLKANLLLGEGKEEEAEAILNSIDDKDDLANIVDVSYMYIDMGFPEKALTWLTRGLEKYAEEEAYLAVTGDCYYAQGLFEKATFFFNKLIDKNPYSAPYWFGLARCYFDQQMFDKAIEACDYATVADDEFADAYLMKGHSFFQLGNEESAMENYLQAEKFHLVSHGFINTFIGLNNLPTQYDPYTPGMNVVVIVLFCVIPMLAWAATLIAMKGYALTGEKMKEIQAINACRRDAVAGGMKLEDAMAKWQTIDQLPAEYKAN